MNTDEHRWRSAEGVRRALGQKARSFAADGSENVNRAFGQYARSFAADGSENVNRAFGQYARSFAADGSENVNRAFGQCARSFAADGLENIYCAFAQYCRPSIRLACQCPGGAAGSAPVTAQKFGSAGRAGSVSIRVHLWLKHLLVTTPQPSRTRKVTHARGMNCSFDRAGIRPCRTGAICVHPCSSVVETPAHHHPTTAANLESYTNGRRV
jgi:hypothetical protein